MSAAALVFVLLTAFTIFAFLQARRVSAERDRARLEQAKAEQVVRVLVDLFKTANPEVVPGGDRLSIGEFMARAEARRARFDEARVLFDEALDGAEAVNGGRSTILIRALTESAVFDARVGDYPRAEVKHRRALALAEDLVGPDNYLVANSLNDLAVTLVNRGQLPEAATILVQSYQRHARIFGEAHWRTVNAMRNVAMAQLLLDEPRACEAWMTRALAASEPLTERQELRVYMRAQLARCLLRQRQSSRGIALLQESLSRLQAIGDDPAYVANVRLWLGRALLEGGHIGDAEAHVTQAVTYYHQTRDEGHPTRAEADCELAHVLVARGRRDEALALASTCVPRLATYGQIEPWRKQSHERLLAALRGERAIR